jgi:NitT/TauT family transport system substrate-binding protein
MTNHRLKLLVRPLRAVALGLVVLATTLAAAPAQNLDVVKVGNNAVISDAVFFIAEKHGYFAEQKIKIELILFDAGPMMIAPLGAGQLDVAAGASSAGLFNAAARGINIKMVADKGSTPPGYEYMPIMVRKALVDSGKVKTFADLKGLKVAEAGEGGSPGSLLNEGLKKGGLTYKDVEHVYMGYPQHVLALANGAIDASVTTEPSATQAIELGAAVRFSDDKVYPNQQVAVLLYGGDFIKNRRAVAERFMIAYVKAARYYNDALKGGRFAGPTADDVIKILIENTNVKNAELYKKMVPNGINPDGRLAIDSLQRDHAFYVAQGYIEKPIPFEAVVDTSFVENAIKALGPYKPKG